MMNAKNMFTIYQNKFIMFQGLRIDSLGLPIPKGELFIQSNKGYTTKEGRWEKSYNLAQMVMWKDFILSISHQLSAA